MKLDLTSLSNSLESLEASLKVVGDEAWFWGDLSSFKIALPPKPIAAAFTRVIQPMLEHITANVFQSRTLATLRDTLLPKLLSGELRVAGLESQLAAAS